MSGRPRLLGGAALVAGVLCLGAGIVIAAGGGPWLLVVAGGLLLAAGGLGFWLLAPAPPAESSPAARSGEAAVPDRPRLRHISLGSTVLAVDPRASDTDLLEALRALSPADFEQFCRALLLAMGYQDVHVQGGPGDNGVDLVMRHHDARVIAQCKRYQGNVGAAAVREFYGSLIHAAAQHGYLLTTGGFTAAAQEWTRGKPIDLVDGPQLVAAVRQYLLGAG